jgi:hypothetical protein
MHVRQKGAETGYVAWKGNSDKDILNFGSEILLIT